MNTKSSLACEVLLSLSLLVLVPTSSSGQEATVQKAVVQEAASINSPAVAAEDAEAPPEAPGEDEAAGEALRVWTSYNGHTMKAEFVALEDGYVVLKDAEGRTIRLRLALLVPADRAVVAELEAKCAADAVAGVTYGKNRLPAFSEGAAKGFHAVYSNANFIARVQSTGTLTVQCLDAGQAVGKPISIAPQYGYQNTVRNKYVSRRILSFDKAPAKPTLAPTVLEFGGMLEDGVTFGLNFEFKGNTVQAWGWVEDPAQIEYPTSYQLRCRFSASHVFEPHVPVAEQKKVLAPYTVIVKPVSGRTVRYPYGDKVSGVVPAALQVEIGGPLFGGRKVSISAPSPREGVLAPWIYRAFAPYQGFSVGLRKEDRSSRSDKCRMVLTIE